MFEQIVNKIVQTGRRHGWLKPFVLVSLAALFGGRALVRAVVQLTQTVRGQCSLGRRDGALRRSAALALAACVAFTLFPAAAFADGADNPPNEVPPDSVTITAFEPLDPETAEQTLAASAEAMPALPESLSAQTAEGPIMIDNVSWSEEPAFAPESEGDYTFTAALPEGYLPAEGAALPVIRVTVAPATVAPPANDLIQPLDLNLPEPEATWVLNDEAGTTGSGTLVEAAAAVKGPTSGPHPGGTITLQKDVILPEKKTPLAFWGNVTLQSAEGKHCTISREKKGSYMLSVNKGQTLTIKNVTVDGGAVWGEDGKGVPSHGAENTSDMKGSTTGTILTMAGTVILEGDTTLQNGYSLGYHAGAVGIGDGGKLIMRDNSKIINNYGEDGGAIKMARSGSVEMTDNALIAGNYAIYLGGGIIAYPDPCQITLSDNAQISDNYANDGGGGIYLGGGSTLTLSGAARIEKNQATYNGGGILNCDSTVLLTDEAGVAENSANQGGGIYSLLDQLDTCSVALEGSAQIEENSAAGAGGGLYLSDGTLSLTEHASVQNNSSTADGGGIYAESYAAIELSGSAQIANNTASQRGGGIYLSGSLTAAGDGVQISQNSAEQGGGIYSAGNATLSGAITITANRAGTDGGGVKYVPFHSSKKLTLSGAVVIMGNFTDSAANNLALSYPATLGAAMGPNANVGFHLLPAEAARTGVQFATGTGLGESDANAFFYDSGEFGAAPNPEGTGLILTDRIIPVTAITGSAMSVRMKFPLTLRAGVSPQNAATRFIVWSLKDAGDTGATVENGVFTAQSAGTAIVTAKVTNGDGSVVSRDFTVTVIPTYEVSGTVTDHAGNTVAGATVAVVQGQTVFSTSKSQPDGSFTLSGVPDGVYNLVVSSGKLTVTQIITIAGASQSVGTISLPQYRQNTIIEITGDVPDLVIGGLNEQYDTPVTDDDKGITQEDLDKLTAGGSVDITCKVTEVVPDSTEDDDAIHSAAGKKGLNARLFVDIQVIKTVTESGGFPVATTLNEVPELLTVRIPLPAELRGKIGYTLYRVHDGEVDEITTTANSDGEKMGIVDGGTFLLAHLRKFSTYAIACKNPPSPSYSGGNISSEFYVTVIAGPNGKVNTPEGFYARDEKHTFTVIPDEGYVIDTVTLDDGSLLSHTDTQFVLLVDEPYEVHVTFKRAATAPAPTLSKNPQTGGTETGAPWLLLLLGMGSLVLARRLRAEDN